MKTILIADDEEDIRNIVRMRLEERPEYRILEVAHGTTALEVAFRERPDLLILDWNMPGMSGLEVLQELRRHPGTADIRVIVITGKDDVTDHVHFHKLGALAYVVKPFSPRELLEKVQDALQ
jgi:DNA-binding response OmpR family regulator